MFLFTDVCNVLFAVADDVLTAIELIAEPAPITADPVSVPIDARPELAAAVVDAPPEPSALAPTSANAVAEGDGCEEEKKQAGEVEEEEEKPKPRRKRGGRPAQRKRPREDRHIPEVCVRVLLLPCSP